MVNPELIEAIKKGDLSFFDNLDNPKKIVNTQLLDGSYPLHEAVRQGKIEMVKKLIDCEADVNALAAENNSPLFLASSLGLDQMVLILAAHGALLDEPNIKKNTPIIIAIIYGHKSTVETLIKLGVNIKTTGKGALLLHFAAKYDRVAIAKLLIELGYEPDDIGDESLHMTPLMLAACDGNLAFVKFILGYGVDVNQILSSANALYLAAHDGHQAVCEYLLKNGASLNLAFICLVYLFPEETKFFEVINSLNIEIPEEFKYFSSNYYGPYLRHRELLAFTNDLGYKKVQGGVCHGLSSLLILAISSGKSAIESWKQQIRILSDYSGNPADLFKRIDEIRQKVRNHIPIPENDNLILDTVAFIDNLTLAQIPSVYSEVFDTHYHQNNFDKVAPFIYSTANEKDGGIIHLGHFYNIFEKLSLKKYLDELSCFLLKTSKEHLLSIRVWNRVHAIVIYYDTAQEEWGFSESNILPVSLVFLSSKELVESTFRSFSDVRYSFLQFDFFCSSSAVKYFQTLISNECHCYNLKLDFKESDKLDSYLLSVASMGCLGIVRNLVEAGANKNSVNEKGYSPLLAACVVNNTATAFYLIEQGADVNPGYSVLHLSPLYFAVEFGNTILVEELIKHGAEVNLVGYNGDTLLITVARKGDIAILRLLIAGGANLDLIDSSNYFSALDWAFKNDHYEIMYELLTAGAKISKVSNMLYNLENSLTYALYNNDTAKITILKNIIEHLQLYEKQQEAERRQRFFKYQLSVTSITHPHVPQKSAVAS